jgi:hypothetical protein
MKRQPNKAKVAVGAVRCDVLFHVFCSWNGEQLRLLLGMMLAHTRALAPRYPLLHPVVDEVVRMPEPLGVVPWLTAVESVVRTTQPELAHELWAKAMILALLPQSLAATEILCSDSRLVYEILACTPVLDLPRVVALIQPALGAWCERDYDDPERFVEAVYEEWLVQ